MNGPYPPIAPPKAPNIRVARSVLVTSAENPQSEKTHDQLQGKPLQIKPADNFPSEQNAELRQTAIDSRTSAFAESLDGPPIKIESKLEPRIEPPGAVYRRRGPDPNNTKLGIISFLCEYPRVRTQNIEPRRNSLQNILLRSMSERRLQLGSKQKTPVSIALKRTSEGRRYSQIVTKGLYQEGINKSIYRVNVVDESSKSLSRKRPRGKRLGDEVVENVKRRVPIESLSGDGQSSLVLSDQMAGSMSTFLNDEQKRESKMQQQRNGGKQDREWSPTPLLPLQGAAESTFGVDFSSILKKHEQISASPKKARKAPMGMMMTTKSERYPKVRDFAEEGGSHFLKNAFRHRSKSPTKNDPPREDPEKRSPWKQSPSKKSNKQRDIGDSFSKLPQISPEVLNRSERWHHEINVQDSIARNADSAEKLPVVEMKPDRSTPWITTDYQKQPIKSRSQQSSRSSNAKGSSTSKGHSKSPSGISGASNDNDNESEVSSAIISDAQSISIHKPNGDTDWCNSILARKPLRPGPAPTTPLPSLPEGHDMQPATPRRSESSQRRPSPQRSPTKSRQKVPVKYRLTPTEQSPSKKPPPPETKNTTTNSEQINKKPAALVRIHTANVDAFPSPPFLSLGNNSRQTMALAFHEKLSTSVSTGMLAARTEHTQKLKAKDLARERSQTVTLDDESFLARPTTRLKPGMAEESEGHRDTMERLIASYDTQQNLPDRSPQPSPMSTSGISDAGIRNSRLSSDLSPIIIVADQEPVTSASVKTPNSANTNGVGEPSTEPEVQLVSLSEEATQHQDSRPESEYSLRPPQPPEKSPRRSLANQSPHKSVANRAPTPFTHPSLLRKDSHGSSQRSSMIERDLEARMAAMEKKNRWLERAFHAVMDASASISSGESFQLRDSGQGFGTVDRLSGSANEGLEHFHEDVTVREHEHEHEHEQERPHADLEYLLARQGRGRPRNLSISSEPF